MPLPGTGLITENPNFIDQILYNFNYESDSPCIDSGDPEEFDPDNTRIDIGACYFYQDNSPTGDCNEDSIINILDIIGVVNDCVLCGGDDCPTCDCADLNEDGTTNILDIILIVNVILYDGS